MRKVVLNNNENFRVILFLLKNVKDTKAFRKKIITGEIDCCALKPDLIVDIFQLIVAANKVARSKEKGKLITKSLNTELLYYLSISKNITQSLNTFGISDQDQHAVIVIFEENNENKFEQMKCSFEGDISSVEEIITFSDFDAIKKIYKITNTELEVSELIDSVVSRISTKDFGSI